MGRAPALLSRGCGPTRRPRALRAPAGAPARRAPNPRGWWMRPAPSRACTTPATARRPRPPPRGSRTPSSRSPARPRAARGSARGHRSPSRRCVRARGRRDSGQGASLNTLAHRMSDRLVIGIDARAAAEVPAGRGRYVRELLRALAARDDDARFLLYARERWEEPLDDRFEWRLIGSGDPVWHLRAARAANREATVFLSTNSYLTAWFTRVPT